jgi:hypothetical protein
VLLWGRVAAQQRWWWGSAAAAATTSSSSGSAARDEQDSQQRCGVPTGLTVTGAVVLQEGFAGGHVDFIPAASAQQPSSQQSVRELTTTKADEDAHTKSTERETAKQTAQQSFQASLHGVLRLRVKVYVGSVSISKVRVELSERVRLTHNSDSQNSRTYTLSSFKYKKIPANETCTFRDDLELIKQFRRTHIGSSKYPPPAGVTSSVLHTTTWLQVTFPDLHAIPEELLGVDVVMIAKDLNLTDMVPFLPSSSCSTTLHQAKSQSTTSLKEEEKKKRIKLIRNAGAKVLFVYVGTGSCMNESEWSSSFYFCISLFSSFEPRCTRTHVCVQAVCIEYRNYAPPSWEQSRHVSLSFAYFLWVCCSFCFSFFWNGGLLSAFIKVCTEP